jgi:isoleucyl-tRNA synthetase
MAPILSFLAEEAYGYFSGKKHESVFLESFAQPQASWHRPELDPMFTELLAVRTDVQKKLEELRVQKIIGSSLEARVTLQLEGPRLAAAEKFHLSHAKCNLREFLIVSEVQIKNGPYLITADKAHGEKCARCWVYSEKISQEPQTLGLCPKCVEALT